MRTNNIGGPWTVMKKIDRGKTLKISIYRSIYLSLNWKNV